jgi:lambda family phage portal protein
VSTARSKRRRLSAQSVIDRRIATESEAWGEYAQREKASRATAVAPRQKIGAEVFGGAQVNRLTRDWIAATMSPDSEIRFDIRLLRARARQLVRDNSYAAGFVSEFAMQVVGPHEIRMQAKIRDRSGNLAEATNAEIEKQWKRWGMPENASADRRSSFADMQRMWFRSLAMDGELILRKLDYFDNEFGFAVQQIDPDLLDETFNVGGRPGQNEIRMGVELDQWGGPVAYHFWNRHPDLLSSSLKLKRERVEASEILHKFFQYRPGQTRGYSPFAPVLLDMKMLGGYQEAELVATRMAAAKIGFFVQKNPEMMGGSAAPTARKEGDPEELDASPGTLDELNPGWEFQGFDPTHPSTAFKEFTKAILRAIARGLGMAYTTLTGDLEAVNYSSIRAGLLSERDMYRMQAQWGAVHLCRPIYIAWLKNAMLTGALKVDARLASEYDEVEWQGRGWKWVDPVSDLQAAELALSLGLDTRHRLAAEAGLDYEENVDQLAEENEYASVAKVNVAGAPKALPPGQDPNARDDQQTQQTTPTKPDAVALSLPRQRKSA